MATFRYLVSDVGQAVEFYTSHLGFALVRQFGPAMAILEQDGLQLWLAGPPASALEAMPDGSKPAPRGWNRMVHTTTDLAALVDKLKAADVTFRNDILSGPGGQQILCEDPSGNPIELFQPA